MKLEQRFGCRLTPDERRAFLALAEREERRPSDMLRLILRERLRQAGLLKKQAAQFAEVSEAEAN